jgi:hypothetical protein
MGEPGVLSSLDEVARAAAKGSIDPRVHTWAGERLDIARGAGRSVKQPHERAAVLLEAVQQKLWIPDPVGSEYIASPHLLACDPGKAKDGRVCVRAGDCDDLSALLGAALSSVGIYTLIVGHAYGKPQLEHVICAAYLPKFDAARPWKYADPSSKYALGQCHRFTRERLISIPNVKLVCDARACIGHQEIDPDKLRFIERGEFVGVGSLPLDGLDAEVVWEVDEREPGELMRRALSRLGGP